DQRARILDVGLQLCRRRADHAHRDDADRGDVAVADVGRAVGLADRVLRQQSIDSETSADSGPSGNLPSGTRYGERFTYRGHAESQTLTNSNEKPKRDAHQALPESTAAPARFPGLSGVGPGPGGCGVPVFTWPRRPGAASWPVRSSRQVAARSEA